MITSFEGHDRGQRVFLVQQILDAVSAYQVDFLQRENEEHPPFPDVEGLKRSLALGDEEVLWDESIVRGALDGMSEWYYSDRPTFVDGVPNLPDAESLTDYVEGGE